ncbi:MAG: DUF3575 domain-containing protein [Bacteroidales bacterium]
MKLHLLINRLKWTWIMKIKILISTFLALIHLQIYSQNIGIKTNLLYDFMTLTPNLGVEYALSDKSTLDLGFGYNPWNLHNQKNGNKKLVHWLIDLEYRYWFCQKFSGHFIGVETLGGKYNISRYKLPMLFGKDSEKYRFQGYSIGAGINYGYHFYLGKRWSLETALGLGYLRLNHKKYNCAGCGTILGREKRNYFGPTEASVSIIYLLK